MHVSTQRRGTRMESCASACGKNETGHDCPSWVSIMGLSGCRYWVGPGGIYACRQTCECNDINTSASVYAQQRCGCACTHKKIYMRCAHMPVPPRSFGSSGDEQTLQAGLRLADSCESPPRRCAEGSERQQLPVVKVSPYL